MRFTEINSHTHLVETDGKLQELSFHGSQCTKDCSGHRAGYKWSLDRGGVENPASHSQSFINGANIGVRMLNQRPQGGGKLPGYASQTTNAVRKRAQRLAARQLPAQPPETGPLPVGEGTYNRTIDHKDFGEMVEMFTMGFTVADIAEAYSVNRHALARNFKKIENWVEVYHKHLENRRGHEGRRTIGQKKLLTPDEQKQVVDLYLAGKSTKEIGSIMGGNSAFIRSYLVKEPNWEELYQINTAKRKELGTFIHTAKRIDNIDDLKKMYADGYSYRQVALKFGYMHGSVVRALKKQPDFQELEIAHERSRQELKAAKGTQKTTGRMRNKPMSQGPHNASAKSGPVGSTGRPVY